MTDQNSIYELRLHEVIEDENGFPLVSRVPGGWIYYHVAGSKFEDGQLQIASNAMVFVPCSEEFLHDKCQHRYHIDVRVDGVQCVDCQHIKID